MSSRILAGWFTNILKRPISKRSTDTRPLKALNGLRKMNLKNYTTSGESFEELQLNSMKESTRLSPFQEALRNSKMTDALNELARARDILEGLRYKLLDINVVIVEQIKRIEDLEDHLKQNQEPVILTDADIFEIDEDINA